MELAVEGTQRWSDAELVVEGKRRVSDAIERQSLEDMREALLFLSGTPLARPVHHAPATAPDLPTTTTMTKQINVTFRLPLPSHHHHNHHQQTSNTDVSDSVLAAAIGPHPIHTQLFECLLTPQIMTVPTAIASTTCTTTLPTTCTSTNPTITILTNAKEKLLGNSYVRHKLLAMACDFGNASIARILFRHGAEILKTSRQLALACQRDQMELATLLLEHGADPNVCKNDGVTPLIRSARYGKMEMVKLLLLAPEEQENDDNDGHGDRRDEFETSQVSSFHKNRWGTNVYHYDQQSMNALMHACAENHESMVRFLALGGVGHNHPRNHNRNCHHKSAGAVDATVRAYVNDYKVDPALWYASAHGNAAICRFLMDDCGAVASYRKDPTVYSSTPLEEASQWGHTECVRVLLERPGSDPRTKPGRKALVQAHQSGHAAVVRLLGLWTHRWNAVDDCMTQAGLPLGVLPLALGLVSRNTDVLYRMLCHHAGGLSCRVSCRVVSCDGTYNERALPVSTRVLGAV